MLFLIIILPLLGALFSGLFGRFVGRNGSVFISIFCMIIAVFIANYQFINLCFNNSISFITFTPWINYDLLVINWGFLFDSVTLYMYLLFDMY